MAKLKSGRLTREVADKRLQHGAAWDSPGKTRCRGCTATAAGRLIGGGADEVMLSIIARIAGTLPKDPA